VRWPWPVMALHVAVKQSIPASTPLVRWEKNHTWSFGSRIHCIVPCEYVRLKSMGKWLHIRKAGVVSTVLSTLGDSESGPKGQKDTIKTSRTCT
jgi:hypothetical protein